VTANTIDVRVENSASSNSINLVFSLYSTLATESNRLAKSAPAFIPADEEFYWTTKWQAGERKALADLEAGRFRQFADSRDAIRWLLREDR
jgi:hypothetical protein